MSEIEYLEWNVSELTDDEKQNVLEDVIAELGSDVGVLTDEVDVDRLPEEMPKPASFADSVSAPRLGEAAEPELILIALESTIIAIEAGKLGKKAKDKASGMGPLVREKFRSKIEERGHSVESKTGDSIESVVEEL